MECREALPGPGHAAGMSREFRHLRAGGHPRTLLSCNSTAGLLQAESRSVSPAASYFSLLVQRRDNRNKAAPRDVNTAQGECKAAVRSGLAFCVTKVRPSLAAQAFANARASGAQSALAHLGSIRNRRPSMAAALRVCQGQWHRAVSNTSTAPRSTCVFDLARNQSRFCADTRRAAGMDAGRFRIEPWMASPEMVAQPRSP